MSAAPSTPDKDSGLGPPFALVVALIFIVGGLWSLDLFLASTDRQAVQNQAGNLYKQGVLMLHQGRASEALDLLRRANSLVRDNRDYQLNYVAALLASQKLDEADSNLKALLLADPDNGQANLLAARMMVRLGKFPDAESHYHRAIYGAWSDNIPAHRMQVRLELARLLSSRGQQEELLAELLALESEAQGNAPVLKQIAHLLLSAGSPGRAATVYRELIQSDPDDSEAYMGLGEDELAQGNYRTALTAFLNANRHNPGNPAIQHGMELCNTMAAIDPTPRRLSSADKYARATDILKMARDALDRCVSDRVDEVRRMVEECDKALAKKPPAHLTNELAEARLTYAEQLWQARIKTCGASTSGAEQPLRLIMAKLAHS